ncbi:hypothetical protein HDV00_003188 [Rhizophlyctis rosea]|nr:hypothetical protein HDV00_003188 [Rhizophlyctis rosea]
MTLNVGTLTGRTFQVEVYPTDTVGEVKMRIFEETGIAIESQILVFRERALADDEGAIGAYGVQSGCTLQLVLHMAGGPGPPLKIKKTAKDDDSVVLLLCKQNEDLYMLELRMRDGESRRSAARQLYRLTSGGGGVSESDILREFDCEGVGGGAGEGGEGEEEFGRGGTGQEGELDFEREMMERDDGEGRRRRRFDGRPESGDSMMSSSTLRSLFAPSSAGSFSRPYSPMSMHSMTRPSSSESAADSALDDIFRDADVLFGDSGLVGGTQARVMRSLPRTPRRRVRPATAISVMRLPGGGGPMIIIPKTRPASAIRPSEASRSILDDTPPQTPPRRPQSALGLVIAPHPETPMAVMKSVTPATGSTCRSPVTRSVGGSAGKRPSSKKVRFDGTSSPAEDREVRVSRPGLIPNGSSASLMEDSLKLEHVQEFHTGPHQAPIATSVSGPSRRRSSNTRPRRLSTSSNSNTTITSYPLTSRTLSSTSSTLLSPPRRRSTPSRKLRHSPPTSTSTSTLSSSSSAAALAAQHKNRCTTCRKKLGPATSFKCRCSQVFCSVHRYSDRHQCSFDYKGAGKAGLERDNPRVGKEKVARI